MNAVIFRFFFYFSA
ncbi:pheST operon leader peptide PheM [Serratia sp. JSRIV001]|nr:MULTISPECIES: pheST operon leader peptide PheM [Enterobacterales]MBP9642045.1 pheST operon leader peptide PheM [Budvicia sp.]MDW5504504.1 pheST operon leader peptide PheM [Pseudomonas lundensis]MBN3253493.1 pheST operon leader peptide PheM [Pectobacterium brasiliense]MDW5499442.1 pheST operon leader peptide PheM [Serratia proteamaculans]MEB8608490.1 pheST operon leader peptide PheM [Cronobacter sakazakii]